MSRVFHFGGLSFLINSPRCNSRGIKGDPDMKKNQKKETEKTVRAAIEKYSKKYGYNALTPSEREFIGGQITFKEFKKRYAGIK
jgi:hypothetical protein